MRNIDNSLILVVDNSQLFRAMLCDFLQTKGYTVCEASNAKESIEVFEREQPKMVLLGAVMPEIDGINSLDACKRMREMDLDEYSPILMVTSTDDDALITAAFNAGASDYINKPIHWALLEHRIKYKLQEARTAHALLASEERFRQLFDDSPLPYQSMDDHGRIVDVNVAWLEMMSMELSDVMGKSFGDLMSEKQWMKFMHMFPSFIKQGVLTNLQLTILDKHGNELIVELNGRVAYDIDGNFKQTHCVLQNVTERKAMEDELQRLATTDSLTGLANRHAFFTEADRARLQCLRYGHPYTAMMLDIDHFKSINDTFGHDVGDAVLKQVSAEMQQQIRDVDFLGRLGGEEFAIILPETNIGKAIIVAERVRLAVEAFSLQTEQGDVTFTISIGITPLSDAKESNEQLIKQADELLYQAKHNGRNRIECELDPQGY